MTWCFFFPVCVQVLVLGQTFSFSILYSQYLLSEGVSSTSTAWMHSSCVMMIHFVMVMVGPLTQEYGTRTVGIWGVTICVAGMLLSAFTPSPSYLYISISLLGGKEQLYVYAVFSVFHTGDFMLPKSFNHL